MKPKTPIDNAQTPQGLPSESMLRLYRAIGLKEFAGVCGWPVSYTGGGFFDVPCGQFKTFGELKSFCAKYGIRTALESLGLARQLAQIESHSRPEHFSILLLEPTE